ncbi:SulP family inorganic anion transporter [Caldilinea sp.]|uniref:SulP family inorganic anion transporter n=1 Tax=Caldilinea sp. TaxID=2293560 RepID=UPI002C280469|nr:SulP family inorganic anion transporter [Caldilinea sp.]
MQRLSLSGLWRREFSGYSAGKFRQDLLAGLTVAAVALPLALAFGVASGATAAAGLVTAILAGLIIGALSGAPYQISGPTGAMSAVLIIIAQRVGVEGVWMTGLIAGAIILVIGLLRMGRFVAFIPSSVITGFTSGIAFIIFVGQIDNFLGVETAGAESAGLKLFGYLQGGFTPAWPTLLIGLLVVGIMIFWPARFNRAVPGSLVGIVVATVVAVVTQWPVASIGAIPRTILLDQRLTFATIPWEHLNELIVPALSVAALGAVESLLCGAVGSKMTGIRLQANQELVAQGIGNLIIPFFGGVPATAAIARSSVGIKSGGQTRLVSIIHALALLAAALLLAPVIALTPLTALAGVLTVTAVRMNEWDAIGFMFSHRFKTGIVTFLITFLATITLDLTQAIIIGGILSAGIFINQVANLEVEIRTVDVERMRARGMALKTDCQYIRVAFLTGPLFFAATNTFNEAFAHEEDVDTLVLSMRAVPLIDLSGIEALHTLHDTLAAQGKTLMLAAMHPKVMRMLERAGLDAIIGKDNFFWSADRAILIAEARHQHLKPQIVDEIESSQVVEPLAMPI